MADGSDDPADLVKYHAKLQEGYDCVFGSRFIAGSRLIDYPTHKLIINRLANLFISFLFQLRYNDVTNAFKCYRRTVIAGLEPMLAHHFNLTVELPLKAIIRGYSFAIVPISWTNRTSGVSKLKIREMGSRYLFIVLYCFIERLLSRGDYRQKPRPEPSLERPERTRNTARPSASFDFDQCDLLAIGRFCPRQTTRKPSKKRVGWGGKEQDTWITAYFLRPPWLNCGTNGVIACLPTSSASPAAFRTPSGIPRAARARW